MAKYGTLKLTGVDKVVTNLGRFQAQITPALGESFDELATRMEIKAVLDAPWTDRTGNARASIQGSSAVNGYKVIAALAIGVDYGKWLELSNAGKYAIVWPTITEYREEFIAAIQKGWSRIKV